MSTRRSDAAERPGVTALARGLSILRCFSQPRIELTVSEIARQVELSQPTTWRLCATLLDEGFLVRSPGSAALRIGAPALTLGYAAIAGLDLPSIVLPYMRQLTDHTKGSVTLSLRRGIEMVSVEQSSGTFVVANQPVGWRSTLTSVASGLAVLAVLTDQDRTETQDQLEARDASAWHRRSARIAQARKQFAAHGFVVFDNMFDGQYGAVAVPLIEGGGGGARYWALSCGGLCTQWDDARLARVGEELKRIGELLQPALRSGLTQTAAV